MGARFHAGLPMGICEGFIHGPTAGRVSLMFLEAKIWTLCRTDSVLVSSLTLPKAFLVRSLVGPSFLGFVLFILPRGSSASVERAGWKGTALSACPISALAVGNIPEGGGHWSREKHGDTSMRGQQAMQGWENGSRAWRSG